jgi:hypothetical protein
MFLTLRCVRVLSFLTLFVLASCAQEPFSSVDRSKYKTVALNPEMKVPDHYVYRDITGKRSRGMVGGVIGLLIGAASEGPGFHRFDAVASKNPIDIRGLVRRHMETALKTSPMTFVAGNADATFSLQIFAYGVGPVNNRELGAVIAARAALSDRAGNVIWKKDEWSTSDTTALLENLEQNPALWPKMANEAAEALAKKLVLYTKTSQRSAPQPLM